MKTPAVLAVLLLITSLTLAGDTPPRWRATLKLIIKGEVENEPTALLAASYIGRELRALGDIEMAEDNNPDYRADVVVYRIQSDHAISFLLLTRPNGAAVHYMHNLLVTGPDALSAGCRDMVAQWDANTFAPARRAHK